MSRATRVDVLALHGFGGAPGSFDDVAAQLRPRGVAVRGLTLPGHGGVAAASFDDAVDAVSAAVDDDTVLWGYSLGARLALAAACKPNRTPRALILESGRGTVDGRGRAALDDARADDLVARGVAAFFTDWERGPLFAHLTAEQRRRRHALRAGHDAGRLAAALRSFSPGRQRAPLLARLRLPVLLIAGADDATYVDHAEQMTRMLPACRLSIIAKCGHVPHFERPDAVAAVIADFLAVFTATTPELRP